MLFEPSHPHPQNETQNANGIPHIHNTMCATSKLLLGREKNVFGEKINMGGESGEKHFP